MLRPADGAAADDKERYAAFALSTFYPWDSREQLLAQTPLRTLWATLLEFERRADLSKPEQDVWNFGKLALGYAQSRAESIHRCKERLVAALRAGETEHARELAADMDDADELLDAADLAAAAELFAPDGTADADAGALVDELTAAQPRHTSAIPTFPLPTSSARRLYDLMSTHHWSGRGLNALQTSFRNAALAQLSVPTMPLSTAAAASAAGGSASSAQGAGLARVSAHLIRVDAAAAPSLLTQLQQSVKGFAQAALAPAAQASTQQPDSSSELAYQMVYDTSGIPRLGFFVHNPAAAGSMGGCRPR